MPKYVAPRTRTEEVLVGIWSQLLRVNRVGIHDDFFQLGADSLAAVRIVFRTREVFGVGVTLGQFFEHLTVARLSRLVDELLEEKAPGE